MIKVALHSVPRSGSTWLGNILDSNPSVIYKYQPHFSYEFNDVLKEAASTKEINDFFKKIASYRSEFLDQIPQKEKGLIPIFKKNVKQTHIIYKEVRYHYLLPNMLEKSEDLKCICLVRNPLAVLYSWMNAPKEFDRVNWQIEDQWYNAPLKNNNKKENYYGYEKWKETLLLFLDLKSKHPDKVVIVTYNDLLHNTEETIEELFEFLQLKLQVQTRQFIQQSQSFDNNNAYSVFKIKKDDRDWQKLPQEIIEYVKKDLINTNLESYL